MSGTQDDEEGTGIYGDDFNVSIPFAIGSIIGVALFMTVLILVLLAP